MNHFYFVLSIIVLVSGTIHGQENISGVSHAHKKNHILSITPEILLAQDFTVQTPALGSNKINSKPITELAYGVCIRFKTKNNLNFETGYRRKLHWSIFETKSPYLFSSSVMDESHSIPFRAIWEKRSKKKRVGISASAGILASFMTHTYLANDASYGIRYPTGTYFANVTYKSKGFSTPRFAPFLDGVLKMDCRIFRHLDLSLGYGGSKGFLNLSEGRYNVTAPMPSPSFSGTIVSKGSYHYLVVGLGWKFNTL
jgi:hypothetical protein